MLARLFAYILVILAYFLFPWWLALLAGLLYVLCWPGFELLILGVVVDSVFGHVSLHAFPLYTLVSGTLIVAAAVLKPHVAYYPTKP